MKDFEYPREFKGVWIPAEIYLDDRLSPGDKILFTEIDSLDKDEKGCYASNEYLLKFCKMSAATLKRSLAYLAELALIIPGGYYRRCRVWRSRLKMSQVHSSKRANYQAQNEPQSNTDEKYTDTSLMREREEKKLFTKVKDSFVSQNENSNKSWNWPAQAKHIKGLVNRAMHMPDPESWLKSVITVYHKKIRTGDSFWHTQPFTPMNLNSEGIMTRVLDEMSKQPVDMGAMLREAGVK